MFLTLGVVMKEAKYLQNEGLSDICNLARSSRIKIYLSLYWNWSLRDWHIPGLGLWVLISKALVYALELFRLAYVRNRAGQHIGLGATRYRRLNQA